MHFPFVIFHLLERSLIKWQMKYDSWKIALLPSPLPSAFCLPPYFCL
jgi:hypothetical protein